MPGAPVPGLGGLFGEIIPADALLLRRLEECQIVETAVKGSHQSGCISGYADALSEHGV